MNDLFSQLSLSAFESRDIDGVDKTALDKLKRDLESVLLEKINTCPGWEGVEQVISALNANGHHFKRRKTDDNWLSYFEETNNATRDFWIHVNREDDLTSLFILYFEKMAITKAKQRAGMSDEEQLEAVLVDAFYDKGLELVKKDVNEHPFTTDEHIHLVLYQFETGVNNGGFETYIINTEGSRIAETAEFLARIGAKELEAIVREVLSLFPAGFTTGLSDEIWNILEKQRDKLNTLDARFYHSRDNLALLVMKHLNY